MIPKSIITKLIAENILTEHRAEQIAIDHSFRATVSELQDELRGQSTDDVRTQIHQVTSDPQIATVLSDASTLDREKVARYITLKQTVDELSHGQALGLSVIFEYVADGWPRSDGAPAGFISVRGDDLGKLVSLYERCLVYAWRDNCPGCETVKSDLAEIVGANPDAKVLPLAVYGPECAGMLDQDFDVVGAPTTLFTLSGAVDSRLVGTASRDALEREFSVIQDRTVTTA